MGSGEPSLTSSGKVMLWVCVAIGIIAALLVQYRLGYDGILWSALFGAIGGGLGGIAGQILARLLGQMHAESAGRGPKRPPGGKMPGGR
jgi:hypothetical protein